MRISLNRNLKIIFKCIPTQYNKFGRLPNEVVRGSIACLESRCNVLFCKREFAFEDLSIVWDVSTVMVKLDRTSVCDASYETEPFVTMVSSIPTHSNTGAHLPRYPT